MIEQLRKIEEFWLGKLGRSDEKKIALYVGRIKDSRDLLKIEMTENFTVIAKIKQYRLRLTDKEVSCTCPSRDKYCKHQLALSVEIKSRFGVNR